MELDKRMIQLRIDIIERDLKEIEEYLVSLLKCIEAYIDISPSSSILVFQNDIFSLGRLGRRLRKCGNTKYSSTLNLLHFIVRELWKFI